jgi:hypothetical protein
MLFKSELIMLRIIGSGFIHVQLGSSPLSLGKFFGYFPLQSLETLQKVSNAPLKIKFNLHKFDKISDGF